MEAYSEEDVVAYLSKYYLPDVAVRLYKAGITTPAKCELYKNYQYIEQLLDYAEKTFTDLSVMTVDIIIILVLFTVVFLFELSILIKSKPIPVQISSRNRTIRATKIPVEAVMPSPLTDMRNPPSRPPNCRGIKNSILAISEVKAKIRMH